MQTSILDIPLRGDRDYMHLPDIATALTSKFFGENYSRLFFSKLVLRSPIRSKPKLILDYEEPPVNALGECLWISTSQESVRGCLVESNLEARTTPYSEDPIRSSIDQDARENVVTCRVVDGYSPIQVGVAVMKLMCQQRVGTAGSRFSASVLSLSEALPATGTAIRFTMKRMIGSRHFVGLLEVDGQEIGRLEMTRLGT